MTQDEKRIRAAVQFYRINCFISRLKALFVIGGSAVGIYGGLILKTSTLDKTNWLYKNIGPDGMKWALIAICAFAFAVGCFWAYQRIRNLTVDTRKYQQQLENSVQAV